MMTTDPVSYGGSLGTTWSPLGGVDESDDWGPVERELASEGSISLSKVGKEGG